MSRFLLYLSGYDETSRESGYTGTGTGSGLSASGVRGLDVQPGEVIDRKYYTGTENRPQEQALGKFLKACYIFP